MEFRPKTPHANGNHSASPVSGGALVTPRARTASPTVFPAHVPLAGLPAVIYGLHRFHVGGVPLSRFPVLLCGGSAFLWLVGALPGRWIGVTGCAVVLALYLTFGVLLRRQHYITFAPLPAPDISAPPLQPQEKLPIYATGLLTVEGKARPFTYLPGFYRTFATGEHAVLCHVATRYWLALGVWPPEELGMWYAFIQPNAIAGLAWGELRFGVTRASAVAVTYRFESPSRRARPQVRHETLYLACSAPKDARRVLADLHRQLPPGIIITPNETRATA